jgi:hypothetical protein
LLCGIKIKRSDLSGLPNCTNAVVRPEGGDGDKLPARPGSAGRHPQGP